jgi:hypothetical protein
MPTQLKNLIKTGMRNPFFIEIKTENEGIFAKKGIDQSSQIKIMEFDG